MGQHQDMARDAWPEKLAGQQGLKEEEGSSMGKWCTWMALQFTKDGKHQEILTSLAGSLTAQGLPLPHTRSSLLL